MNVETPDPVLDALREILAAEWSAVKVDHDYYVFALPACGWYVGLDVADPRRQVRLSWDGLTVYAETWTTEQAAVVDQIRDRMIRAHQAESIALGSKSISVLVKLGGILKTKRTRAETP